MSFVKDLLKHIEQEDRKYVPLKPREESLNEKWLKHIEEEDRKNYSISRPPNRWEEDPVEYIRKLKLEMEANPNAFRIKKRSGSKRRTSKRKTSKRRGSKRRTSKRRTSKRRTSKRK